MSLNLCSVRRAGGALVIVLPAQVDVTNADQVGTDLTRALCDGTDLLVVDMTASDFCDSAGVQVLVRASHRAAAAGVRMRLAAGSRPVLRVLELTGADQVIDLYADLAAATHGLALTG